MYSQGEYIRWEALLDLLEAIHAFVRVVEAGSFSVTARERGVSQSTVSKQVAALETHLGAELLRRTSRSFALTEPGAAFYESAVRLLSDLEAAESNVGRRHVSPAGLVRATVAPVFGGLYLIPKLQSFFAQYPNIDLELRTAPDLENLIAQGLDIAIHNGPLTDSSLIMRKIASVPVIAVAAPSYLEKKGTPTDLTHLEQHDCIVFAPHGDPFPWKFTTAGRDIRIKPKGRFRTHDAEQIRAAVLAGLGVAQTPGWLFTDEVASGRVIRVLREYEPGVIAISAVYPGSRRLASKARVFAQFVAKCLAEDTMFSSVCYESLSKDLQT
jgi:LysR family transcriptional regulator, regulator for bpeEF and oprC